MSELSIAVDPANIEQTKAWDGDEGAYWAHNAERFDRFMTAYHAPFLTGAAITATDRVLDIGCGTGQTTRDAARAAAAGSALGVDLSAKMIGYARQAAHRDRIGNATFEQGDAQIYPFPAGVFDVAISRTGAMFFGDPVAAFANIARALRPGGRLCLLTWQPPASNEWIREIAGALTAGRDLPLPPPGTRAHLHSAIPTASTPCCQLRGTPACKPIPAPAGYGPAAMLMTLTASCSA